MILTHNTHRFLLCILLPALFLLFFLFGRQHLIVFSVTGMLSVSSLLLLAFTQWRNTFSLSRLDVLLLSYAAWLFLTLLWTSLSTLSSICAWILAMLPLSFFLARFLLKTDQDWYWLYGIFVVLFCGLGLWAVYQYWFLHVLPQASLGNKNLLASLIGAVLLPLCAYYFNTRRGWVLAAMCLLVFCFGTIYGRVATVVFAFLFLSACGVLIHLKLLRWRAFGWLLLALIVSYGLARFPVAENYRLPVTPVVASTPNVYLTSPLTQSGFSRWALWKSTWYLIQQHPVLGSGLSTFPYEYASIRPTSDITFGLFAHNDFLQLWDEGGLPAALLLFAVPFLAGLSVRRLFKTALPTPLKIEALFLWAGVALLFVHGLFCFDLYGQIALIWIALLLARLMFIEKHALASSDVHWTISLAQKIRPLMAVLVLIFLLLLSTFYFVSIAASERLAKQGSLALQQGRTLDAFDDAEQLKVLRPRSEAGYVLSAQIDIQNLASPVMSVNAQQQAYQDISRTLDRADKTNRWNPAIPYLRARLAMVSKAWLPQADKVVEQNIQAALARDPRFYTARLAYAEYLYSEKHTAAARAVLEAGLAYHRAAVQNAWDEEKRKVYEEKALALKI